MDFLDRSGFFKSAPKAHGAGDVQILGSVPEFDLGFRIIESRRLRSPLLGCLPPMPGRFDFRVLLECLGNHGIEAKGLAPLEQLLAPVLTVFLA